MSAPQEKEGKTPCGVLCLDKPEGITSHDAVNRIRHLYGTKQVGHTGTLDPMATGVLPLLLGRAAKAAEYLTAEEKEYHALLRLGVATDTEDITGKPIFLSPGDSLPEREAVVAAAKTVAERKEQIPPMYSAIKIGGRKLLELARENITVERPPRPIEIFRLDVTPVKGDAGLYRMEVCCSKGTYVRSLCRDIGELLGCGGTMAGLRRARSGGFTLRDAVSIETLEAESMEERIARLLPAESVFQTLPRILLPPFFERLAKSGQEIYLRKLPPFSGVKALSPLPGVRARLCSGEDPKGGFFALGEVREFPDGMALKPIKQFVL